MSRRIRLQHLWAGLADAFLRAYPACSDCGDRQATVVIRDGGRSRAEVLAVSTLHRDRFPLLTGVCEPCASTRRAKERKGPPSPPPTQHTAAPATTTKES